MEGPTITPVGFSNIVNKPNIAAQLYRRGFKQRLGFSYWNRGNSLTNHLFRTFDKSQIHRVSEFAEVLSGLRDITRERTYVQIVINGLDGICHHHSDRPPVELMAESLYEDRVLALADSLHRLGCKAIIYAVADHGILWRPAPGSEEDLVVVRDTRTDSRRFAKGTLMVPHTKHFAISDTTYTTLAYPFLFTPITRLEWGVHGGISFQESVVPFAKVEFS